MAEERKKLGLLKDLPAKLEAEIVPYFEEAVTNGIFPTTAAASAPRRTTWSSSTCPARSRGRT